MRWIRILLLATLTLVTVCPFPVNQTITHRTQQNKLFFMIPNMFRRIIEAIRGMDFIKSAANLTMIFSFFGILVRMVVFCT